MDVVPGNALDYPAAAAPEASIGENESEPHNPISPRTICALVRVRQVQINETP